MMLNLQARRCDSVCESSEFDRATNGWRSKVTALVTAHQTAELVELRDPPYMRYGDWLLLDGSLTFPPDLEDFDYPAYLARQGIGSVMSFPEVTLLADREGN